MEVQTRPSLSPGQGRAGNRYSRVPSPGGLAAVDFARLPWEQLSAVWEGQVSGSWTQASMLEWDGTPPVVGILPGRCKVNPSCSGSGGYRAGPAVVGECGPDTPLPPPPPPAHLYLVYSE